VPLLSAQTFTMRKLPTDAYGTRPTPIQASAIMWKKLIPIQEQEWE
jgi:hypothetical protein